VIRRCATECLKRVPLEQKLRLLGVRVSGLTVAGAGADSPVPVQAELPFGEFGAEGT
jgi:DNA polymerase-4